MSTRDTIIKHIQDLTEKQAKEALAELLLNMDKIGFGDYTLEKCMKDYEEAHSQILIGDLFNK